ncbi:MAG: hypothetical protein LBU48_01830 [Coriobacteriales bacterium]|jgi:glycine cleavage system aminomethyltransferase T|nr:hypothetical protein [Coriobacteriales bacterium]
MNEHDTATAPCFICDMSDLGKLRLSGEDALDFIRTMFSCELDPLYQIGGCAAALLLTGEAEVIDVVLLIRTGDAEFMVTTSPQNTQEVYDWLEAHGRLKGESGPVFAHLDLSNETGSLSTIALIGSDAAAILDELASGGFSAAPRMGQLVMAQVDTVPAMVFAAPLLPEPVLEVFCAPGKKEGLLYGLMSFPQVSPLSLEEYQQLRADNHSWFAAADVAAYAYPDDLKLLHLVRGSFDFVGGKALQSRLNN